MINKAIAQGWTVDHAGHGLRWRGPERGQLVFTGSTPHAGHRSIKNIRAVLRRHGLDV